MVKRGTRESVKFDSGSFDDIKNELDIAFGSMAQNKKVETILPEPVPVIEKIPELRSSDEEEESSDESDCNCAPILVADDNEFNLFTLQQLLLTFKLTADGASNGKEAYEMVEKSLQCCPYKVIFMDQNMPIMDGLESTRMIIKIFNAWMEKHPNGPDVRKIPIIALTANDSQEERQACLQSGMSEFLCKPPDMKEFRRILKSVF